MTTEAPTVASRERQAQDCCVPSVQPDLGPDRAADLAVVAKALSDPTRLRIVDAVRTASPEMLCQCELVPLFDMSQAAVAKHLKVLVGAGVLGSERRGVWTYYHLRPEALKELSTWLS
ncbi:ArsR/SmtB family transcription factor [Paraconexibacter sp.]|uniref:ArsR/SmtB family transcription factor n=1 Tax=Paraconexibacter sp. TaxID=2949640 RepID=UPI003568A97B